jgi:CRP/FNR family transcriptional regulator, anaerobic regulatory protein
MSTNKTNSLCTDVHWIGRSDCKLCNIRHTMLFSTLPEKELAQLLLPIDNFHLEPYATLYNEHSAAEYVYSIRSGWLKLEIGLSNGNSRITRLLGPGDVVGLEALVGSRYRHSAIAMGNIDVCRIPCSAIHQLNSHHPVLFKSLLLQWEKSLEQADFIITELSTGTAKERVAKLLDILAKINKALTFRSMSRGEMASILGLTTETVSRIVAELKRSGHIVEKEQQMTLIGLDEISGRLSQEQGWRSKWQARQKPFIVANG